MSTLKEEATRLICGHCGATFSGTIQQADRTRKGVATFCSDVCRYANLRAKFSTPVPTRGPCGGCGQTFPSRREAKFCGMKCYTGSKQFSDMLADARAKSLTPWSIARRAEKARRGEGRPCLECGIDVYRKKSEKGRKFCSTVCYRAYMAKRFDRWLANPEGLALPQGYDGFLDREELPCMIEGCGWTGRHLSLHINQAHGIRADELKRAAGFNLSTGLVSRPLAELLRERKMQGVAADEMMRMLGDTSFKGHVHHYISLERKEHAAKTRALMGPGPMRRCIGCGISFRQSTPFGKAKYCTIDCRTRAYARKQVEDAGGVATKPTVRGDAA